MAGDRRAATTDGDGDVSEATVKVHVGGERIIATGEGNGPVNALDYALRRAVAASFPELAELELVDYKVRILDGRAGTDAITRVLVEHRPTARSEWTTVGVHENVDRGVLAGAGGRLSRTACCEAGRRPTRPSGGRRRRLGCRGMRIGPVRRSPTAVVGVRGRSTASTPPASTAAAGTPCVTAIDGHPFGAARAVHRPVVAARRRPAARARSCRARSSAIGQNYAEHAAEMGGEAAGRADDVPQAVDRR